jgi:methylenetetrahydrofolate dehydrogenase (NADP+)/methenyltetrahydrofolate cyclohydrolase/formyltetrahydrofolate synthetase
MICWYQVIVGGRKDSESYVSHKVKACEEVGIDSRTVKLPEAATEQEVVADVRALCSDESVDGVLVQLPLPSHVAEFAVRAANASQFCARLHCMRGLPQLYTATMHSWCERPTAAS